MTLALQIPQTAAAEGWQAHIRLELALRAGRSTITRLDHRGPLRVQRPFYPEGQALSHIYLLHPPGGMVTGDRLQMDVLLQQQAQALITTPSAGKIYRGDHSLRRQQQHCRLQVADEAVLEWLPQETIVFNGARGELFTEVDLASSARCLLWDIVCLGRPASGERFLDGYVVQKLLIRRGEQLLYHERNCFEGGNAMLQEKCGLQDYPVSGSLMASVTLTEQELCSVRESLEHLALPGVTALSQVDELLLVRHIGPSSAGCRLAFEQVWACLRPYLNQRAAITPRVWNT